MWNLQAHPARSVVTKRVAGESVLVNLSTEEYFGLDAMGTRIWEELSRSRTIGQVVESLLNEYEVSEPQLRKDLEQFVSDLESRGLLELRPPAAG